LPSPEVLGIELALPLKVGPHTRFERPLQAGVREARLLN
jgi:hypothetical protein